MGNRGCLWELGKPFWWRWLCSEFSASGRFVCSYRSFVLIDRVLFVAAGFVLSRRGLCSFGLCSARASLLAAVPMCTWAALVLLCPCACFCNRGRWSETGRTHWASTPAYMRSALCSTCHAQAGPAWASMGVTRQRRVKPPASCRTHRDCARWREAGNANRMNHTDGVQPAGVS